MSCFDNNEARWDHERDQLKHDTDRVPPLPLFLQRDIPTAYTIAALCQSIPIEAAAKLIEQYARTVASGAAVEAAEEAYNRVDAALREVGR